MRISKPEITQENGNSIYQVGVDSALGIKTLWYSLHNSFSDLLTHSSDAPLVALLIPAMLMGEDIHIDGTISERLFYNLLRPLQRLLRHVIPSLNEVEIYPENLKCDQLNSALGVATGFSGGIDSYCVLADHVYSDIPESFKVTHLLFNNVGSHTVHVGSHTIGGERLFRERYERLLPVVERIGLPFLIINSNLDIFYGGKIRFQQTHTLRNASVALLLQRGVGRFMYASTFDYSKSFVGSTYDLAYSDTITLPLLSTDAIDIFSVGSEYTRVQKTLRVAELSETYETLDICVNPNNTSGYTNCGKCWKCLRTLTTLEIAGYIERYSSQFDLNAYRTRRNTYFATLIGSHDPLIQEIVKFAEDINYSFPISSRFIGRSGILPVMSLSKRTLRKIRHLFSR